ncbi:MAG TPA: hypothetical protein VE967_01075, partial [Gemmatimonadaceae bacterium]|nr:hypothetical protein [Gemmatimonadaceae bacterium]
MARSVPSPLGAVLVGGGLQLRAQATGAPTVAVRVNPSESTPRNTDGVADAATWQLIQSTERVHLRLREDEIRQFGGSRSTPLQPVPARLVASAPPPPPQTRTVFVNNPAGGARIQLNVTLKRESAHVIYYQDDAAVGTVDESTDAEVQAVLDYYEQYGQSVIDDYFGGLGPAGMTSDFADGPRVANDIDGNGKFIVVQTTQAHMLSGAAAYVSSCDRFPRTGNAVGNVSTCANSNESEITYMLRPDSPYYRGVIVHETKHIASMGFARFANRGFQPSWIEEGTADIAAELSSRHASNVAERQEVRRADVFPTGVGTSPTDLSYYMYIANSRARSFLLASPLSALFADPSPNPNGSTIYGAGWLFHRYLADRYAPTYGGEAAFFRVLNLQGTGNTPIENLAGKPFSDVLSDFMAAIIAEGSAAKRSGAPERFVSYDFADIATRFSGAAWPYLQRTSTYGPSSLSLPTYFSAPNFVEFTSTPGKTLRLDILQTNGVPVTAAVDAALTIQRIR